MKIRITIEYELDMDAGSCPEHVLRHEKGYWETGWMNIPEVLEAMKNGIPGKVDYEIIP